MNKGKHKEICRAKYKIPDSKFILDIVILDNGERLITEKSLLNSQDKICFLCNFVITEKIKIFNLV